MDISIVIPVYNEAVKIPQDIQEALDYFQDRLLEGEVIISDDGSKDDTISVVERIQEKHKNVKLLKNEHQGKGSAVKSGIIKAIGNIIIFIDSGSCIPYSDVHKGVMIIKKGEADIAHASRFLPNSSIDKPKQIFRQLLSRLFRVLIPLYMGIYGRFSDTQCGLKIYKKKVGHRIYNECITKGFMFDIETIKRADLHSYKIKEFPIHWTADPDSRLSASKTLFSMIKELNAIKNSIS